MVENPVTVRVCRRFSAMSGYEKNVTKGLVFSYQYSVVKGQQIGYRFSMSGQQLDGDFQDLVVGSKLYQVSLFAVEVCALVLLLWFIFHFSIYLIYFTLFIIAYII